MYKDDNEFRPFCDPLNALALLPLWEVHEGMQYIKQTMSEAAEPLVDYFDRTYVSGRLRGIRPTKRCKKVYTELRKRLCNPCEDRTSGSKTIAEFIRGVSYNIRGGQPNM
jgi:hypothetical protein